MPVAPQTSVAPKLSVAPEPSSPASDVQNTHSSTSQSSLSNLSQMFQPPAFEQTPPRPVPHGTPGDRRRLLRWRDRVEAIHRQARAIQRTRAQINAPPSPQQLAVIIDPPSVGPPAVIAYTAPPTPSFSISQSQGSIAGHIPPGHHTPSEDVAPRPTTPSPTPGSLSQNLQTNSSQQDSPDSLNVSQQQTTSSSIQLSSKPEASGDEWLPDAEDENIENEDEDEEDEDEEDEDEDEDNDMQDDNGRYTDDDDEVLDFSINAGEQSEGDHNEMDLGAGMDDTVEGDVVPQDIGDEEEQERENEDEDDPIEHQEHLLNIQQALAREADKPNSAGSASTSYSEDIMREVRVRERAVSGLLDLGRDGLTLEASEEQFNEFEQKLMALQRQFTLWHHESLAYDNERIDVAIRAAKEHAAAWLRNNRKQKGGGGGVGKEDDNVRRTVLDEDEEEEFEALLDISRLNMEQRIVRCVSAQELIDDLERCPPVPLLHDLNLVDALVAIDARCSWLSTYFHLISTKRAVAWLQMRGPLASNLINLWTWKLEYNVDVKIDYIQDVNIAFGKNWCLLELLRRVENGEEGSAAERFTIDLYSTKYIKQLKALTRPRPLLHNAGLPRVSAWMTSARFHFKDTLSHRNVYDSPPTHYFAAFILDNMSYAAKWHLANDIEDWPIPMFGWPEALLKELKNVVANVQRPVDPFNDEDLANFDEGARIKNISSKDWRPKRPPRGVITGPQIAAALDNAWYNGKANEDNEPPEEWDELRDEFWLDMAKLEKEEKRKRRAADQRKKAEQKKVNEVNQQGKKGNKGKKRKRDEPDE
ncbi:hypothetical protein CALCODRAFT_486590 [Calocera cornea HHB12733]|uniref:Uncharacterized protein n=1 Tax=Calocera cornea HHB12733 TaxID=1353952 RepID=A0A165DMR7_9BASI|nr:hypothetical protein CALCODRAFT_486590 [Calocera cornea HHB12733]